MNKKICILGAGGHTRSLINLIELNGLEIEGIYDTSYDPEKQETIRGYDLKGDPSGLADHPVVISIGDISRHTEWYYQLADRVFNNNIIHPDATIEKEVSLGNANQVFARVYINSGSVIGDDNIINTGATIEHEVKIGSHNHIAVGAIICGRTEIGDRCFIGAGATIIDKVKIADNVIIGANAVIISDITEAGTYAGNPARRVK